VPKLRLLSYNIHSQRDDQEALASVVRTVAPDLVVVQEAPRRFWWRAKCAAIADSFGMVVAGGGLPSLGNLVVTTLRVRVHGATCLRYPLTPGRHMRGAVLVRCSVERSPFVVVGSHLSTDPAERPAQAGLLKAAVADLDAPLVLAADVNETSGGAAWRTLADGLTDAADAAGKADCATFSCHDPQRRIDLILTDPRIRVLDYDVVDTPQVRRASDHFPVLAELELPEAD
jgi:endonuclease/exonuclease/phosphatase family metal-dependent hydrolase